MDFQELGLTLQREREAKGLTIEAVMEATKISRINLVALEKGDPSSLPHPVYTKGFIKSYARLLGLDPDEMSMVVDREFQPDTFEVEEVAYDVSPAAEQAFQDMEPPAKRRCPAWLTIFLFLAVALGVVLLVLSLNNAGDGPGFFEDASRVSEGPVAPVEEEVVSTEPTEPVKAQEGSAPPEAPALEPVQEQALLETAVEPVPTVPAVEEIKAPEQPLAATEAMEADTAISDTDGVRYAHVLIVRAKTAKGCWVGLWKGDEAKMARDFVLKKGEPLRLMFNSPRRIRIGNVAGVDVTYNGEPYPLEDNGSNIQTLVFGKN